MTASIAEQIEQKTSPDRVEILQKYRQIIHRSSKPRSGDATALIETGRKLGLSDAEIASDARAWEEARALVGEIPSAANVRELSDRREAAGRALDEATIQTAGTVATGIPSGRLTAAASELRTVEAEITAQNQATHPAMVKLLALKEAHPLVFDNSRRTGGNGNLKICHTMLGFFPHGAVIEPEALPDVLAADAPAEQQAQARAKNVERLIALGAVEWTDEPLTVDLGEAAPTSD